MANEVQVFNFEQMNVRTVEINGTPYFVAKDIAYLLDVKNSRDVISNLDEDEKGVGSIDTPGGKQKMNVITESGVYEFIGASRKPAAENAKRWLRKEVLPSIRKHGAYLTNEKIEEILLSPDTLIKVATELKNEREKNVLLTQQVSESRPKADYYDKIMQSKSLVTITQIAKDYGWSAKQMNDKLHSLGVQYKIGGQWVLYSKYQDKGYTFSTTVDITKRDGSSDVKMNTKWTQKGRVFIYNLLKVDGILPTIEQEI
ncbi:phage antirepressor [Weissella paramesenteroides]|uniref:phage antirepressor n=1 Tax=Weissella paramesenteroides TaxID=1249 RepID=UPI002E7AE640|nr:phage antirepressor KilAC domain-containing protein [Weissella paramesenteroides]WPQ68394.1 phage antirepressor KilAC domain-containing protein [Weissella paramesenteroides]